MKCNLRGLRTSKRLSQNELSEKTGINKGHISLAENGRYRFTYDERLKIESVLGESVKYFVMIEDREE